MTVFDIWVILDDIRFLVGMIGLLVLFTFVAVVAHVARHWNDNEYEENDDAGESTDDRT